ncbi:MAG: tetratricopeptide repeat protein, partial [Deltaproteobacteria bacterium]|nr:tetratricopeptide repeat protein [Deltaproteobacteria bacterium]
MNKRWFLFLAIAVVSAGLLSIAAADTADDLFEKALEAERAGELETAVEFLTRAAELDSRNAAIYVNRGGVYAKGKQFDKAIEDFNRALNIDPDNIGATYNRGTAYFDQGDLQRALNDYDSVLRMDEGHLPAL